MFSTIFTTELMQIMNTEEVNIIDVREIDEFYSGHIPGSVNLPLSTLSYTYMNLDRSKHYFIICRSGNRSQSACVFLSQYGYSLTNILGGIINY